jgi:hypothetical protein
MIAKLFVAAAIAVAPLTVGSAPAQADTVCGYAPGKVVAVGATSCQFAMNVANKMTSEAGTSFMAYSPETGQSYLMSCSVVRHGSVTCTGGNGAEVDIY